MRRSMENGNHYTASHEEVVGNPEAGLYDKIERTCTECGRAYEVGFPHGSAPPPDQGSCALCLNKDKFKAAAEQMKNWPPIDKVYGKKQ